MVITVSVATKMVTAPVFMTFINMFNGDFAKYTGTIDGERRAVQITFIKSAKERQRGLQDVGPNVLAYCEPDTRQIRVYKEQWDKLSFTGKRVLIYHELGHCAYNLEHDEEDSLSIMAPNLLTDWKFRWHKDLLLSNFFQKAGKTVRDAD